MKKRKIVFMKTARKLCEVCKTKAIAQKNVEQTIMQIFLRHAKISILGVEIKFRWRHVARRHGEARGKLVGKQKSCDTVGMERIKPPLISWARNKILLMEVDARIFFLHFLLRSFSRHNVPVINFPDKKFRGVRFPYFYLFILVNGKGNAQIWFTLLFFF